MLPLASAERFPTAVVGGSVRAPGPGRLLGLALLALIGERLLFGPLALAGQGPDLLVVLLLAAADRERSARAGIVGFALGLCRDLTASTRMGTWALTYLLVGLLLGEFDAAIRWSGVLLRGALAGVLALVCGALASVVGWVVEPATALTGDGGAIVLAAAYTAVVAGGLGLVVPMGGR